MILLIPYSKRAVFCKKKKRINKRTRLRISHVKTRTCVSLQKILVWTFDWAKEVRAVTKTSSSSVSADLIDTLMMWIGFSFVFWGGGQKSKIIELGKKKYGQNAFLNTGNTHLDALLLIETRTRLCHWRTFQQRFYKTGEDLIKIPAKNAQCIVRGEMSPS